MLNEEDPLSFADTLFQTILMFNSELLGTMKSYSIIEIVLDSISAPGKSTNLLQMSDIQTLACASSKPLFFRCITYDALPPSNKSPVND